MNYNIIFLICGTYTSERKRWKKTKVWVQLWHLYQQRQFYGANLNIYILKEGFAL